MNGWMDGWVEFWESAEGVWIRNSDRWSSGWEGHWIHVPH